MKISDYIKLNHSDQLQQEGNVSAFARAENIGITQARRFVEYDCIVQDSIVYKPCMKLNSTIKGE